jgi:tRNA pseudouridine38-40 synthase
VWWIKDRLNVEAMSLAAASLAGRHDFTAFSDKRLAADESRIVVVESCQAAAAEDLILVRMAASHFLWKMVRKLIAFLVEIGRGEFAVDELAGLLRADAPGFQPTAPPSGLFLEAVLYEGEPFDRPLVPIVPVTTWLPRRVKR